MKTFFELLRADFLILLRGRVGMFWTLAFPALMMVMQMTLFGGSAALGPVSVMIVNSEGSGEGQRYADYIHDALSSQTSVRADVTITNQSANADVVILIPGDFTSHVQRDITSRIEVTTSVKDPTTRNAVLGLLRGITDAYNIDGAGKPRLASLDIKASALPKTDYTLFIVTGLAGMITLSTSLMGFAPVLVGAREGGMFKMYRLFPMWRGTVLLVWISSRLMLTLVATLLMFTLATLLYKLKISAPPAYALAAIGLLAVGAFAFLAIGMAVATWSSSVATATMLANLLYFPLLFSGNVMIPVSGLPKSIRDILDYLPLNALVGSLRDLLIGSIDWPHLIYTLALLTILSVVCLYPSFKDSKWLARG